MKFTTSWLFPALVTAASAASDASVFVLSGDELPTPSNTPALSPEQARLVFAQRLGVSQYHSLKDVSETTLSHINTFGTWRPDLFEIEEGHSFNEVVLILDGASTELEKKLQKALPNTPNFYISSPPSMKANAKLAQDMSKQYGKVDDCEIQGNEGDRLAYCWTRGSKVLHYDLSKSYSNSDRIVEALTKLPSVLKQDFANAVVILMPSSRVAKSTYGTYDMPNHAVPVRRQVEEPIGEFFEHNLEKTQREPQSVTKSNSTFKPITGVPPVCYSSLDDCSDKTNNCSGHGKCFKKRAGVSGKDACFACGCTAQNQTFTHGPQNRTGNRIIYWGGAACQKQDVSGPFWLISIFTVVLVGLITWSIGLMYSVGEEKLPGVIGAGVSNNRAK